jgi:hypothetical protein
MPNPSKTARDKGGMRDVYRNRQAWPSTHWSGAFAYRVVSDYNQSAQASILTPDHAGTSLGPQDAALSGLLQP